MATEQRTFTEAELQQLRQLIKGIHITLNSMAPGSRALLHSHGFSSGKFQGLKRGTFKLMRALEDILTPTGRRN